jgi:hypothetical protein
LSLSVRPLVLLVLSCLAATATSALAAEAKGIPGSADRKFAQLGQELPTPTSTRIASGAPGRDYWQQRASYRIQVALDERRHRITASQVIHYENHSPDPLSYLWLQLDQNTFSDGSISRRTETAQTAGTRRDSGGSGDSLTFNAVRRHQAFEDREYGFEMAAVTSGGATLRTTVNDTMMRVDLPTPLQPGGAIDLAMSWAFNIPDDPAIGTRGGFERFEDGTFIYALAQWFPRLAAYTDYTGWQHKQFLGRGEFTLEFGDYEVAITVPADHVVAATGTLQNPGDVLSAEQQARLKAAETAKKPVFIVTPAEAKANEAAGTRDTKTWRFAATNVRDFAWSSSRKFIWDAQGYAQGAPEQPLVMAMSFYPNDAEPAWSRYSTQAVIHTMEVYSRFSFPYPYPVAISVNSWERGGMEYPMLSFNGYRPSKDEKTKAVTYSREIKYGLIGVVIHEVGHNYFPMIVNSDERQWSWMDEGLNSFLEYLAELEWEEKFLTFSDYSRYNVNDYITDYMKSRNQVPVMTNSESIVQFGPNAYSKPTAALAVLREAVMGRELFDHAFRQYAQRWKFKRPTPSDFFRTMEDASGVDLDWFWRGWFYGTDHVDVAITDIREYQVSSQNPDVEFPLTRKEEAGLYPQVVTEQRNAREGRRTRVEREPWLRDFYNENDPFVPTNKDRNDYQDFRKGLKPWELRALDRAVKARQYVYFVDFRNVGGLVTPLPLTIRYAGGDVEELMIPAEIWRLNAEAVTKLFIGPKRIVSIEVDARHVIADVDYANNVFPQRIRASRIELYKQKDDKRDQMLDALAKLKSVKKGGEPAGEEAEVPLTPTEPAEPGAAPLPAAPATGTP